MIALLNKDFNKRSAPNSQEVWNHHVCNQLDVTDELRNQLREKEESQPERSANQALHPSGVYKLVTLVVQDKDFVLNVSQ
ncbi:hypothetical protein RB195_000654 [Necator americanus]|uniref:Uncharacterized protein n=1 Tax=Necator americanus TaxID=51031 RepID=A0ABR1DAR5_NECAM